MHFDLIDHIDELNVPSSPDQGECFIRACKNVSSAEEYLNDHFPSFPVLPGVMMLETLAQAARKLVAAMPNPPKRPMMIQQVRGVKYANMVRPGEQLIVEVKLKKREDDAFDFVGTGTVNGGTAVTGKFRLCPA